MDDATLEVLLQSLKQEDEYQRELASAALWQRWFYQKGEVGNQRLQDAQALTDSGRLEAAERLLSTLVSELPDFAEAWNRRAVLYFVQHRYREAMADCEQVIKLVPYHFGALHGLGLCHAALGQYGAAIQAFRQALGVQPYALVNQRLILECTAQLS
ncbi:tetratricopeptide repeat protein [Nodosilinea sp. PGN35]|uniref:tetratricopeptide repeat protein n=1 Tax=Nodosilinea sp. PGN35 TaxID=3020489 RepID=UPI0023B21262|nr:tetratricopeptide repeat protein [Nodosilinea sp. TSF1-S3]MDF0370163.1 tetratricopeptide repeat protein [Nodosilinea sp. TSF1-S3]